MKLGLKHFILRANSLILYRESVKLCYTLKDKQSKNDMLAYIRSEFESSRNITDEKKIEYLLGIARKRINEMKDTLDFTN